MSALSVTHSTPVVAVCGLWCCISVMPLPLPLVSQQIALENLAVTPSNLNGFVKFCLYMV